MSGSTRRSCSTATPSTRPGCVRRSRPPASRARRSSLPRSRASRRCASRPGARAGRRTTMAIYWRRSRRSLARRRSRSQHGAKPARPLASAAPQAGSRFGSRGSPTPTPSPRRSRRRSATWPRAWSAWASCSTASRSAGTPLPRPSASADARRPLFFDGASIGSLAIVGATIAARDEELLARLADAGALALGIARLRARARGPRGRHRRRSCAPPRRSPRSSTSGACCMRLAAAVAPGSRRRWRGRLARRAAPGALPGGRGARLRPSRCSAPCSRPVHRRGRRGDHRAAARWSVPGPTISEHPALAGVQRELAVPIEWGGDAARRPRRGRLTPNPAFTRADVDRCRRLRASPRSARRTPRPSASAAARGASTGQPRWWRPSSPARAGLLETQRAIERAARSAFEADACVRLDPAGERGPHATAPVSLERAAVRERRVVASARADADARLSARSGSALGRPGALLPCRSRARAPAPLAGVVTVLWRRAARVRRRATWQLAERLRDAAGAAVERASLEEAERRASTLSRELQRVGALAGRRPRCARRAASRSWRRRRAARGRCLRPAPARGGPAGDARRRGRAGELLGGERLPVSDVLAAEVLAASHARGGRATSRPTAASPPTIRWSLQAGFAPYLGAPIASADGGVRGVLAVYDRRIRRWRPDEVEALAALRIGRRRAAQRAAVRARGAAEKERRGRSSRQIADAHRRDGRRGPRSRCGTPRPRRWRSCRPRVALGRELAELLRSELGEPTAPRSSLLEATGRDAPPRCGSQRGERELWLSVTRGAAARARRGATGTRLRHARRVRGARARPAQVATSWPPSRTSCARR